MKSEFKPEMKRGVHPMSRPLKAIYEYIKRNSKVQEVHHYRKSKER